MAKYAPGIAHMLAFFGSKLGAYMIAGVILLLVIGGVMLHMRAESQTIIKLNQQITLLQVQTESLQKANDAMRTDINNVEQAQQEANNAINAVRDQAAIATKLVRNRTFTINPTNTPTAIQTQINKETSDIFSHLEAISRAK